MAVIKSDAIGLHPEIKKVLIRKHIAAVSTGITSTIISMILAFARWEWLGTSSYGDAIDIGSAIITVLLFAGAIFLLMNKRGFESEVSNSNAVTISTIVILFDLAFSFGVSCFFSFTTWGDDPTKNLLLLFMLSFAASTICLTATEFSLFHVGSNKQKVYGDE